MVAYAYNVRPEEVEHATLHPQALNDHTSAIGTGATLFALTEGTPASIAATGFIETLLVGKKGYNPKAEHIIARDLRKPKNRLSFGTSLTPKLND